LEITQDITITEPTFIDEVVVVGGSVTVSSELRTYLIKVVDGRVSVEKGGVVYVLERPVITPFTVLMYVMLIALLIVMILLPLLILVRRERRV